MESDLDWRDVNRSTVYIPDGIVATSQPRAAEAGVSVLRGGGNAFDAAVATAATLKIVEPPSAFGGGEIARSDGDIRSGAAEPRKDGQVSRY